MRNRIITAVSPLNNAARPASAHVYFPMHEQEDGANADLIIDYGNQSFFSGGTDLTGTEANMWSIGGGFTPPGDQDYQNTSEEIRAFFDLSTLNQIGGFAVLVDIYLTQNPLAQTTLYDHSSGVSPTGGHQVKLTTGGALQVDYRDKGSVTGLQAVAASGSLNTGAWNSVAFYFDMKNSQHHVYSWLNGAEGGDDDINGAPASCQAARGLGLFCRRSGAATVDDQLNSESEAVTVRDLRFIRFEYDALPIMGKVASEASKKPYEFRLINLAGV